MKTRLIFWSLCAAILMAGMACQKGASLEEQGGDSSNALVKIASTSIGAENEVHNWKGRIKSEDGVLIFESTAHLTASLLEMSELSYLECKVLEQSLGFTSQWRILQEIMIEEERSTDAFYQPYSHLSNEEIRQLGLKEPRTPEYSYALRKGLLHVWEDSDTAHTYYLSVIDPTAAHALNEDGYVMVGDTLWQYTDRQIKNCSTCTVADRQALGMSARTDLAKGIITYTMKPVPGEMAQRAETRWDGNLNKTWEKPENNRRVRFHRHGFSSISDDCNNCFMIVKFFIHVQAQRLYWGSWRFRNSYEPWFRFDGSWDGGNSFYYCDQTPGAPSPSVSYSMSLDRFTVPLGVRNTPMVDRRYSGNNNSTGVLLHNHSDGQWPPPPNFFPPYPSYGKCWNTPMSITNIRKPNNADGIDGKIMAGISSSSVVYDIQDDE